MRNSADAIRGLLGILYAGGVSVAADPDWPAERLRFISADAQTVYSMTDEACRALREKDESAAPLPEVRGGDEVAVYYTSGSTGQPKGAVLHHIVLGTLLDGLLDSLLDEPGYETWDIFQCLFKIHFVPILSSMIICFSREKTLLLPTDAEHQSIERLAAAIDRQRPDTIGGTPSVILRFLENPAFARAFSGLKYISLGGEKLTPAVIGRLSRATGASLLIPYGSSEMLFCSEYLYRNDGEIHLGKPGRGIRLYPLDENLEPLSSGQEGELFIGGTTAEYGHYLNRPDLDAEKYLEHPRYGRLFRTGDLVRLETGGELTILGRADGMVKLHGQRLEIAEIENCMTTFPGVRRAAVRILGQPPHESLAGYYTVSEAVAEPELRRYLADRLPYYMVPSLFRKLDEMPENAHGKLDYLALPPIAPPEPGHLPPCSPREKLLCEVFAEVLKRGGPVGADESFLALGGDSISAMAALSQLRKRGYSFELRWLFAAPSARALAPLLLPVAEEAAVSEEPLLPEPSPGQREAIERNVGWENVDRIYPVTAFVRGKLAHRDPYVLYRLEEIDADTLTREQLERRLTEMTEKHQALRSVFLCTEGEEPLQVVLRSHRPDSFYVDLRALAEGEGLSAKQKAYFRNLLGLDTRRPKDLERDVLFRVGLIRSSETRSVLFFGVSHLLLDGIGLDQLLRELTSPEETIVPDRALWQRHFAGLVHADHSASLEYWKTLLRGCGGFTSLPRKGGAQAGQAPELFYAAGGNRFWKEIAAYCSAHQATVAALLHFAFGRMLMALSATDDVCFLTVGSGRTAAEAELPGMFLVEFPVRLRRKESLADCQAQLLASSAHAGLWGISEPEFTAGWEKCPAVLDVATIFAGQGNTRRRIEPFALSDTPQQHRAFIGHFLHTNREDLGWRFLILTEERSGFSCVGTYNSRRYDAAMMQKLPGEFLKQLRLIMRNS